MARNERRKPARTPADESVAKPPHPLNQRNGADSDPPVYGEGIADRRVVPDRRWRPDDSADSSSSTGLERRRGPGRRRSDFMKSAEEGEMTKEQFLFLMAIDTFKRVNHKTFPTWTDVLEIIRRLGYRKVQPSQLTIPAAEDWRERADAPASVSPPRPTLDSDSIDSDDNEDASDESIDEAA